MNKIQTPKTNSQQVKLLEKLGKELCSYTFLFTLTKSEQVEKIEKYLSFLKRS